MKRFVKILKYSIVVIGLLLIVITLLFGYRDIPLEELKSKYAKAPSSFVKIGEMDVHYRDEGNPYDSIPVVLIHGTGSSLHTFDEWVEKLKVDHRVIRMDLPAYGLTGPFPDRDYSIANYVAFIDDFLESLNIEKCVLGGNSLGGGIAWNYTAKYPRKVDKLILIDATGYPTQSKSVPVAFKLAKVPVIKSAFTFITPKSLAASSVKNVYSDKTKVDEELIDRYFELTLRAGNRQAFVDRLQMRQDSSSYVRIKDIEQETLIIWGDQDQLIPLESAYKFHEDLRSDTLVILKDVGHVPMEESPLESVASVIEFLKN